MNIRKATFDDIEDLYNLYINHLAKFPPKEIQNLDLWREKLSKINHNPNYYLLVALDESTQKVVSSVTIIVIENLTHNLRPYAVIENVVTHEDYRKKGYATALMNKASEIAEENNCYKIMLMTGSKKDSTLKFYENCEFATGEKTAFLKRL